MRVCIIGSGPAGMRAADLLTQAGAEVTVLEKSNDIGGKCLSIAKDGNTFDMGAILYTMEYNIIKGYVSEFGLADTDPPNYFLIDRTTGVPEPMSIPNLYKGIPSAVLGQQFGIYFATAPKYINALQGPGFLGINDPASIGDLKGLSMSAWLAKIGAPLVERVFWTLITSYGYGFLDKIPAIYPLKFMTVARLVAEMRRMGLADLIPPDIAQQNPPSKFSRLLNDGYQNLIRQIAGKLKTPPITNVSIQNIQRVPPKVIVHYRIGDSKVMQQGEFDKLIMAIPPLKSNLDFLHLTKEEERLFGPVSNNNYYSTLTSPTGFGTDTYEEFLDNGDVVGPPTVAQPIQFSPPWAGNSGYIFWTNSPDRQRSLDEVQQLVAQNITQLGGTPGSSYQNFGWQYFPQYPQASIDAGYYDQVDALQGQNDTYWTGGFFNFELVEKAMQYSDYIVSKMSL